MQWWPRAVKIVLNMFKNFLYFNALACAFLLHGCSSVPVASEDSDGGEPAAESVPVADASMEEVATDEGPVPPNRDLDEDLLRDIAAQTGGKFFRARDPEAMAAVYDEINRLEPVPEEKTYRPQKSLFHWPLGAGLALSALMLALHRRLGAGAAR